MIQQIHLTEMKIKDQIKSDQTNNINLLINIKIKNLQMSKNKIA